MNVMSLFEFQSAVKAALHGKLLVRTEKNGKDYIILAPTSSSGTVQ
jgi:hypothetical protein